MEWFRHNPRAAAIAAAAVTVLCIVVVWVLVSPSGGKDPVVPGAVPTQPTRTPLTALPTVTPKATPTKKATGTVEQQVAQGLGSGIKGGSLSLPGLQGGSYYKYLPKHHLDLSITSQAPIGTVGYVVPTSLNSSSGVVKNVGNSWHLATTVYGNPDYAQLFMQAGQRGYPITCTITVDGHVTEHRSTEGPYGQLVCQG